MPMFSNDTGAGFAFWITDARCGYLHLPRPVENEQEQQMLVNNKTVEDNFGC